MPPEMTDPQLLPVEAGEGTGSVGTGYLTMFDLFRVVVCLCVLGQHSFLWTDMANNVIGTACITVLHFTRNAFFFLTGVVVCYAQITRPRTIWGFWVRRYVQIGIPYLAWTGIYVLFTILRPGGAWNHAGTYFWTDIRIGYYQLYVIIVLFQFYLVFPFLLKLLQWTSTRQHVAIMSISVAIALFIGVDLHYNPHLGVVGHDVHQIGNAWVWSRNLISYQVYFVAGALVAYHFEAVFHFVRRWSRQVLVASAVVGVATILWYFIVIWMGATTASASDIYEPIAVAWSFGAVAGVFALGVRWSQRRTGAAGATGAAGVASGRLSSLSQAGPMFQAGPLSRFGIRRPRLPSVTYLAELTGGFYLCHILFINMIRAALYSGLVGGEHLPWPIRTATFYLGTLVVATTFVSLILRTPLRWVLGGPVRAEQRVRDDAEVAMLAARAAGQTGSGTGGATATSGPRTGSGARIGTDRADDADGGVHGPGAPDTLVAKHSGGAGSAVSRTRGARRRRSPGELLGRPGRRASRARRA